MNNRNNAVLNHCFTDRLFLIYLENGISDSETYRRFPYKTFYLFILHPLWINKVEERNVFDRVRCKISLFPGKMEKSVWILINGVPKRMFFYYMCYRLYLYSICFIYIKKSLWLSGNISRFQAKYYGFETSRFHWNRKNASSAQKIYFFVLHS